MSMSKLLDRWKQRLIVAESYTQGTPVPGLDVGDCTPAQMSGIHAGRYVALKMCIDELEKEMRKEEEVTPTGPRARTYLHTCGL